jgi:hypothetical protein
VTSQALPPSTSNSTQTSISPFIVGRPLRARERIFGRDDALRFIAGELSKYSSINIIGERRMGKTSLINHLIGHQSKYLISESEKPQIVLARIDLQQRITCDELFYGSILRELLNQLVSISTEKVREFESLRKELRKNPEADYTRFEQVLRRLADYNNRGRLVVVLDEFEILLKPVIPDSFLFPSFFDSLRSLITADLMAMIIASRIPLFEYFSDPVKRHSLTSTFPTYFTPFVLRPLDQSAADALLLQPSIHPLTLSEVEKARRWAKGHPCHLQVAGAAWFMGKTEGHSVKWVYRRYVELRTQNCMVSSSVYAKSRTRSKRFKHLLLIVFWQVPIIMGRPVQKLGSKLDDIAAWLIGVLLIILGALVIFGVATGGDILNLLKKLGF